MPQPNEQSQLWQYDWVYKAPVPLAQYGLTAARHMYQYGTTLEQLSHVAVTARGWAQLNPKAFVREPLTLEQAMASPKLVEPLRRSDCCLRTDGGGVLILTRADRARDARSKSVRVLGASESCTQLVSGQMPDMTTSAGAAAGREALAMAGVSAKDVDFLQPYDAFTITPILAVEDLGFVAKGEGGPFFASGAAAPGGSLPCMTSGGGLSYCHPGQFGVLLLIEAVRQLRHECGERQVPGAEVGVCYGFGGFMSANSTVVLARD